MTEIRCGTAVALISRREVMKGRVRRPPRFGKVSVYWVRRLRASSVCVEALEAIEDSELVAFLDQQDTMHQDAWKQISGDDDFSAYKIVPPTEQPDSIKRFIRTGEIGMR